MKSEKWKVNKWKLKYKVKSEKWKVKNEKWNMKTDENKR